jgi:oxygen-independent coproporphyrinogen-3 oxidase
MRAIANAKAAGFDCVDANLIYGVPTQFPSVAPRDVEISIKLGVDQISAYPLFTFVHTGLGRRVAAGNFGIYGDRARIRTQKDISSICRENGLQRTSVWSFSRAEISPYTTVTHSEYRGFGAGAGSRLGNMLSFNTFSVRAFAAMSQFRPALVLRMNERLHRLHWLYWQIYRTHVDASEYARTFSSEVDRDFTFLLAVMHMLGWVTPVPEGWRVTESGAIWAHRIQCLFSLTYIDDLWTRCKLDPWPREVVLDGTR